jgi:hypothetical protein
MFKIVNKISTLFLLISINFAILGQLSFGLSSDFNKYIINSQYSISLNKKIGLQLLIEGGYYGDIKYEKKDISSPYTNLLYEYIPFGAYTSYRSSSRLIGAGFGIGFYNDFEINFGYLKLVGSLNYLYIQDEFKNQIREFSLNEIYTFPDKTVNFSTFYFNLGLFHYFKFKKKSKVELYYGLNMMFYIPNRNLIYSPDDGRNLLVGLEPNCSLGIRFTK